MKIPSADIPQADELRDVLLTVEAVASGAQTYNAIASSIGKVERQGRYYRRAGEILGFIENRHNHSVLTPFGQQYVAADQELRKIIAIKAVLSAPLFQRIIPFIERNRQNGVTRVEFEHFLAEVTEKVGSTMIHRRASTVLSWLSATGIVKEVRERYFLTPAASSAGPIEYESFDEPLLPPSYHLRDYDITALRARSSRGAIEVMIDMAARERAVASHQHLVNCVALKLRQVGSVPRFNKFVDLAATIGEDSFLFEMKSSTKVNYHAQFRRAISQLYEYRYLQQASTARLVVVMEHAPGVGDRWLVDYAVHDRGILLAWNGQGNHLFAAPECDQNLHFLI